MRGSVCPKSVRLLPLYRHADRVQLQVSFPFESQYLDANFAQKGKPHVSAEGARNRYAESANSYYLRFVRLRGEKVNSLAIPPGTIDHARLRTWCFREGESALDSDKYKDFSYAAREQRWHIQKVSTGPLS